MSDVRVLNPHLWPLKATLQLFDIEKSLASIEIRPGITTLVGPNGSGKTRALRAIKAALANAHEINPYGRKMHFLSAGRSSPLESYRGSNDGPNGGNNSDLAVGSATYRTQWSGYESVTGVLLALAERADLRVKIEARLQQLFDRSIKLVWGQSGLNVYISPVGGGASYAANYEASGILQLVALLAAIHNDEIGALVIDEPEISLHPQHQAFLLEEMEAVAGDPAYPDRKLIVIATHAAAFLPLRSLSDLPALKFFNSVYTAPSEVLPDAPVLNRAGLATLVARLSATHRQAMFADRVLMVEGPTDEILANRLARRLDLRLLARNAQVLPVNGKSEFVEAAKLFRLMGKTVAILADLDALSDENLVVRAFSDLPSAQEVANKIGRSSIIDLDRELRDELSKFIKGNSTSVATAAAAYSDWSSSESSEKTERRVTLARILSDPASFGEPTSRLAGALQTRYMVLLDALESLGCFFLRRGAIENYYTSSVMGMSKPQRAAEEAESFELSSVSKLQEQYSELAAALIYVAPNQKVDENLILRPKLSAIISAVFQGMTRATADEKLNALARNIIGDDASIFHLRNASDEDDLKVSVEITSPIFRNELFPFSIGSKENVNVVIPKKLPRLV